MRRVFKTHFFARWSRKAGVPDQSLCVAVEEMERGLIDADLGGNLYKKRIAIADQGKRGGVRVIIATKWESRWLFLIGYAKNEQAEPTTRDLNTEKKIAREYLQATEAHFTALLAKGMLEEICHAS